MTTATQARDVANYTTLQAAIADTPSRGELYISAGTWLADAPLCIDRPMRITGPGTITYAFTGADLFSITSSDVKISGPRIEGPGIAGAYVDGTKAIRVTGPSASNPLQRIDISGVDIVGVPDSAIWAQNVHDITIENCDIDDTLYAGVMLLSVTDGLVEGCRVENVVQKAPVVNTYGIAVSDVENTAAARSRNVIIANNVVKNVRDWEGIDTHGGENIVIMGNEVIGCHDGIAAVAGNSTRVIAPRDVMIVDNLIDSTGANSPRHAIRLYGCAKELASGTIRGNRIQGGGWVAPLAGSYIEVAQLESDLWITSTPAMYGMPTVGGATRVIRWTREGNKVTAVIKITLADDTVVSGIVGVYLPVKMAARYETYDCLGSAIVIDSSAGGAGRYNGSVLVLSTDGRAYFVVGSNTQVSSYAPFAMAAGDKITAVVTYEVDPFA